jgi:hypothetical protein
MFLQVKVAFYEQNSLRKEIAMSTDKPPITPQQYELIYGGGAEAAQVARQRLSRRRFLRRSMGAVWSVSTMASVAGTLAMLYPNLAGQFGSTLHVGNKAEFLVMAHTITSMVNTWTARHPGAWIVSLSHSMERRW